MKIRVLVLILFLSIKVMSQHQVEIDSLVDYIHYSEENFSLLLDDKSKFIEKLLNCQGDHQSSKTWLNNLAPVPPEEISSSISQTNIVSREAVALYLIEAIIREELFFKNRKTIYPLFLPNPNDSYKDIVIIYSLGEFQPSRDIKNISREVLNMNHFRKMYTLYHEWFNKIKKTGLPLDKLPVEIRKPLKGTFYGWEIQDFKGR